VTPVSPNIVVVEEAETIVPLSTTAVAETPVFPNTVVVEDPVITKGSAFTTAVAATPVTALVEDPVVVTAPTAPVPATPVSLRTVVVEFPVTTGGSLSTTAVAVTPVFPKIVVVAEADIVTAPTAPVAASPVVGANPPPDTVVPSPTTPVAPGNASSLPQVLEPHACAEEFQPLKATIISAISLLG